MIKLSIFSGRGLFLFIDGGPIGHMKVQLPNHRPDLLPYYQSASWADAVPLEK